MDESSYKEFEATTLFCSRCKRAVPVRRHLLLVLPTGNKYDYRCTVCGASVGGKEDNDPTEFYRTVAPPADPRRRRPPIRRSGPPFPGSGTR